MSSQTYANLIECNSGWGRALFLERRESFQRIPCNFWKRSLWDQGKRVTGTISVAISRNYRLYLLCISQKSPSVFGVRRSCLISPALSKNFGVSFLLREKEKRECKGQMGTSTYSSLSMWLGLPCNMAARSASKSRKSQPGGDYKPFYDLVSGDMEGHDPHIVITGMDSLRPAHIKGERDQNPPFDKKNVPRTCRLL